MIQSDWQGGKRGASAGELVRALDTNVQPSFLTTVSRVATFLPCHSERPVSEGPKTGAPGACCWDSGPQLAPL